ITQGTLALSGNYNLTFTTGVKFEIKKRPVTVAPDAGQFKNYGDSDPTLTYTITSGTLVTGDSFSGAPARDPGNNVGTHDTTLGTTFEIKKRPIQVTATAGQFKTYGDPDPVFAYTVTSGSLAYMDSFTGALSRVAGQNVGLYAITIGTLAISDGNSGNNYMLSFVSNNFEIKKRPMKVTTNANKKKYYGVDEVALA